MSEFDIKAYLAEIKLQSDEFDALEAVHAAMQSLPAIVDDDYPEKRHKFEGALQSFFEAAQANGRFKPNARFGMRLPHNELIRFAADKFRDYQKQHETKAKNLHEILTGKRQSPVPGSEPYQVRLEDTKLKAAINDEIATRLENFLKGQQ